MATKNKTISKIRRYFNKQKMSSKLLSLYIVIIVIPIAILTFYTFSELQESSDKQFRLILENFIESKTTLIKSNMNDMQTLSQLMVNQKIFSNYLLDDRELTSEELLYFKTYFANDINRISNANSNINQCRIFFSSDKFYEMWPSFYSEKRLSNADWKKKSMQTGEQNFWDVFADELLIPETNDSNTNKVVALYNEISGGAEHLGYVEVTMELATFFGQVSSETNDDLSTIVISTANDDFFYSSNDTMKTTEPEIGKILSKKAMDSQKNKTQSFFNIQINNENYLVVYTFFEPLSINVFALMRVEAYNGSFASQRAIFLGIAFSLVLLLVILTYIFCNVLLKRLNTVIRSMREFNFEKNDFSLEMDGSDEAAELARHFKSMMLKIKELVAIVLKKQEVTKDAEIKALQTQINAHFIYNTLETIKMMAEIEGHETISDSITYLGRLMRYSMSWKNAKVKLIDELQYVKNYIALLNIRNDFSIVLNLEIEEKLKNYEILKMTVQPVIENAVKHGIDPTANDAVIKVKAFSNDDNKNIVIEISDNGSGMTEERLAELIERVSNNIASNENEGSSSGIGLRNINERIQLFYGTQYGIQIYSRESCFTKVVLVLPAFVSDSE